MASSLSSDSLLWPSTSCTACCWCAAFVNASWSCGICKGSCPSPGLCCGSWEAVNSFSLSIELLLGGWCCPGWDSNLLVSSFSSTIPSELLNALVCSLRLAPVGSLLGFVLRWRLYGSPGTVIGRSVARDLSQARDEAVGAVKAEAAPSIML